MAWDAAWPRRDAPQAVACALGGTAMFTAIRAARALLSRCREQPSTHSLRPRRPGSQAAALANGRLRSTGGSTGRHAAPDWTRNTLAWLGVRLGLRLGLWLGLGLGFGLARGDARLVRGRASVRARASVGGLGFGLGLGLGLARGDAHLDRDVA